MAATRIESFIFLDMECSGFEAQNEIAELALVSVHRQAMQNATDMGKSVPRVVDKLVLCVDPGVEIFARETDEKTIAIVRQDVTKIKYKESGLSQSLMETSGKAEFDENVGKQIVQFLERQAQPACLIAHNGSEFDFLILARKLASVGVTIPDIRCGDSLKAFRNVQPGRTGRGSPYGLTNLYLRAFGRSQEDSHNAESDAIALMKVVMKAGSEMRMWFDKNAVGKLPKYRHVTCSPLNIY